MQQQDRLWYLLSRYLTGDASAQEIKELQTTTRSNPGDKILVDTLCHFWQTQTVNDIDELKNAWDKHVQRMD